MQDTAAKLTVLHDDDGVFVDHSDDALDYGRDSFAVNMAAADDRLLVGFEKRINGLYLEMATPNAVETTLTAQYFDGTIFKALSGFSDNSKGFSRNGFFHWDRNLGGVANKSDEEKTTINGLERFWYSFVPSIDTTMTIQGLNLVFADDQDLRSKFRDIDQLKPAAQTSFILEHQAARNTLIQELRNRGNDKSVSNEGLKSIHQFDLLDRFEIREAATFKALSIINFNLVDDVDSSEYQKHLKYEEMAAKSFELFFLSLDRDDDGILDRNERLESKIIRVERI